MIRITENFKTIVKKKVKSLTTFSSQPAVSHKAHSAHKMAYACKYANQNHSRWVTLTQSRGQHSFREPLITTRPKKTLIEGLKPLCNSYKTLSQSVPAPHYFPDFFTPENIIGYTGNLAMQPTVYFQLLLPSGYERVSRITQQHSLQANIGREIVHEYTANSFQICNCSDASGQPISIELLHKRSDYLLWREQLAEQLNQDSGLTVPPLQEGGPPFILHRSRSLFKHVTQSDKATIDRLSESIQKFPTLKSIYHD